MACYSLLIDFMWTISLYCLMTYSFAIDVLLTASQLFVNCWMRATASIVRAKRFYSDDILSNCMNICSSSFHHLCFFLLFLLFFSLFPPLFAFSYNRKRCFPVIATDRFIQKIENNQGKSNPFLIFGVHKGQLTQHAIKGGPKMTQSDLTVTPN